MAIAIDDRMVELGANLGWGEVGVTAHRFLQEARKSAPRCIGSDWDKLALPIDPRQSIS
jgi:hypothetical protein